MELGLADLVLFAAILMPAGFFLSVIGRDPSRPTASAICIAAGGIMLVVGLAAAGVGLIVGASRAVQRGQDRDRHGVGALGR